MNGNADVLVIGGGVAGCVAAAAVLDAGKKVTVVAQNGGNSEVSGGAVDILGVIPGKEPRILESWQEGLSVLLEAYPGHVYGKCQEELGAGVAALAELAGAGGYPLTGFEGHNVWIPNMLGTFSVNAYVPEMMKESVLEPGREEKVLVAGIKGNVSFHAQAAAMSYQKYQQKPGGAATYYSTEIKLSGWGDRRRISDGELADYLDTEAGAEEFVTALQTFCQNNRYHFDKLLLPAAMGCLHYMDLLEKIQQSCNCKVGEVQVLGNSVAGYRFTRAIYRGLEKKGATILRGVRAKELRVSEDQIIVECVAGLHDQLHPGADIAFSTPAVVLATGGFLGGGIRAHRTEVWVELLNQKLGAVEAAQLDRNAVSAAGQDFIRMGVEVNKDMAVQDASWKGHIYACGNVLAGQNFASERSGAGIAAASGYLAGRNAAARA